jgi:hypothetical protein
MKIEMFACPGAVSTHTDPDSGATVAHVTDPSSGNECRYVYRRKEGYWWCIEVVMPEGLPRYFFRP